MLFSIPLLKKSFTLSGFGFHALKVPNSGLSIEIGHTDYDNHTDQSFINFRYSNSIKNPGTSLFSNKAFERISMKDRIYEKVRRENIIKKKGTGFTVKAGGF